MGQVLLLERTVLEIAHDRIKLGHRVTYGSTGCKDHATPAGQLILIAALHKHIRRFLGFRGGQTCHISHFCVEEQILERMALVHKQPVYTQLFKSNNIILLVGGKELVQSCFQSFSCFFHLLDGKVFATLPFQLRNRTFDLINLLPQLPFLSFIRKRDFFKLAVTDDNRIIVTGGDSRTKLLAVCCFKILLCSNKKLGAQIEVQELICPL